MLAGRMEGPVVLEVAVRDQRAELEDGFGAGEAPAGTCDVETVTDQMASRPRAPVIPDGRAHTGGRAHRSHGRRR